VGIQESRISCAAKRVCIEDTDEVIRELVLLRLRHGVSEKALDNAVGIFQRSLDYIQARLHKEVPNFSRHKRSFDEFCTAMQQAATAFQRRSFIDRVFDPVVRDCIDIFALIYLLVRAVICV